MSWPVSRLDTLAELCLGKMLDKNKNRGVPRPYLRNINVRWGAFELSDVQEMRFEPSEEARYTVRRGDVVVCEGGEPGRCAVWSREEPIYIQKAVHRVRCKPALVPGFLAHWLRHLAGTGRLARSFTGTTIHHLPGVVLAAMEVPHPEPSEQRRVVSTIDTLLSRVDAAVASLTHAKVSVASARASTFKSAVEGRLVPTEAALATAEGRPAETAAALLESLRPGRGTPTRPATETGDLSAGWTWCRVADAVRLMRYGTSAKCSREQPGVPVLRMGNIVDGRLDLSDLKYLPPDHPDLADQLLTPGDILFSRTNSAELVGKAAVYHGSPAPCACASYLIRLVPSAALVGGYLSVNLNSAVGRAWVRSVVSQQVGQANVNGTKLGAYTFALPPLPEQHRIIAEVDRRMSVLDEIERSVEAGLARCARLHQAILKRAFEGRLVLPVSVEAKAVARRDHSVEIAR